MWSGATSLPGGSLRSVVGLLGTVYTRLCSSLPTAGEAGPRWISLGSCLPPNPPPPGTKEVVSGAFCSVWVDRGVSGSGAALYSPGSPRQHGAGLMCSRFILDFKKWPVRTSSELMEVHCHDAGLLTVMLQMPSSTPSHKQVSPMLA